jgi:hypothetical protein
MKQVIAEVLTNAEARERETITRIVEEDGDFGYPWEVSA